MAVTIMCPNLRCRKVLMVPDATRGTRVRCSYCNTILLVPQAKNLSRKPAEPDVVAVKKDTAPDKNG